MPEQTSPWRGRRVLVTGVTGFLGGAVARELLTRGAHVVGLVHQRPATNLCDSVESGNVRFVRGRADNVFRLHSAMAVNEVSAVFHLAACDASALLRAVNLYSRRVPVVIARRTAPLAIARTEETREERLSVARFDEVFGPGGRALGRFVDTMPADGPARDFVFVRDATRACLLVAESTVADGPGEHTFRSGWHMTERQLAVAIRDHSASRAVEVPDVAPLSNPLGWQPTQSFAEALGETLTWYRKSLQTGNVDTLRAAA